MTHSASPRLEALALVSSGHRQPQADDSGKSIFETYGEDVFSLKLMRERLPREVCDRLSHIGQHGRAWEHYDADVVACAMKDWALSRGATHYTHWFQPMTGLTAEKHDAFLAPMPDGAAISDFSGKHLIKGEPDASSFPSGGLRSTFEARGYTAWDPTSPAFVLRHGGTVTLCIPTVYYSYTGESLDRKTPLLRSVAAISREASRLMKLIGLSDCEYVTPQVGTEQEYFLVDRRLAQRRPDLVMSGRTLFGARPAKGQQMSDHFFAAIPQRVLEFMNDAEKRLFALGVPVHTRHNEVAPCQYEVAPIFESVNVAIDHNMLVMEVLSRTAEDHDLTCLLHEKPFKYVNGSGKHNNWSLMDNTGRNLLDPGHHPAENLPFLVTLAAIMRAIHLYSPVWRIGIAGAGNDHRLGANEAPPAIVSAYVGGEIEGVIDAVINGDAPGEKGPNASRQVDLGVHSLPSLFTDSSDRNRTSPMAFTGNKFEFRALGASQSSATINIALNVTVARTMSDISDAIEKIMAEGKSGREAARELLPKFFKEHRVTVFNGDNYSAEWVDEAARRGLPNLKDSVQALALYDTPAIIDVFESQKVLSRPEILARQQILLEDYIGRLLIEADLTLSMGRTIIEPVGLKSQDALAASALRIRELTGKNGAELKAFNEISALTEGLSEAVTELEEALVRVRAVPDEPPLTKAAAARDNLLPAMAKLRDYADRLESRVEADLWPFPTYADIFWSI